MGDRIGPSGQGEGGAGARSPEALLGLAIHELRVGNDGMEMPASSSVHLDDEESVSVVSCQEFNIDGQYVVDVRDTGDAKPEEVVKTESVALDSARWLILSLKALNSLQQGDLAAVVLVCGEMVVLVVSFLAKRK